MTAPAALVQAAQMLAVPDRVGPLELASEAAEAIAEALVSADPEVIRRAGRLAGDAVRLCNPYHVGVAVVWYEQTRQLLYAHALAVGGTAWAWEVAPPLPYTPFTAPRLSRLGHRLP